METKNPEATQLALTPESANPPTEAPQTKPAVKNRYAVPEVIPPAKDKPFQSMEERRKERREEYLRSGS
jgi:hypothetical protein